MRVLFVSNTVRFNYVEPLGMMILSQVLRDAGHETRFVGDHFDEAAEVVRSWEPDVVATTLTTGEHNMLIPFIRKLKEIRPFFALVGGPHATFFPDVVKKDGIDAACQGEGEGATLDVITALAEGKPLDLIPNIWLKNDDGSAKGNPARMLIKDLDSIPYPDRETYYAMHPGARIHSTRHFLASRGCVFDCTYCFNREYYGNIYKKNGSRFRYRSPENLVDEVEKVIKTHGGDFNIFVDDIFPVKPGWLEEFGKLYQKRVGIKFRCYTRIELIKPEMCKLLKAAGCHSVEIGLESGNERLRKEILDRSMSNKEIRDKCAMLHEHGIMFSTNNILGFPKETVETALETLKINREIKPQLASAFFFQPYPGTEAGRTAQKMGLYDGDVDTFPSAVYQIAPNYKMAHRRKLSRLRALMGISVGLPGFAYLTPYLIHLPLGGVYRWIGKFWAGYSMWRQIPTKYSVRRFIGATRIFLKSVSFY